VQERLDIIVLIGGNKNGHNSNRDQNNDPHNNKAPHGADYLGSERSFCQDWRNAARGDLNISTMEWAPCGPRSLVNRARDDRGRRTAPSIAVVTMAVHIGVVSSNRFLA